MIDRLLAIIAPHYCLQCAAEGELWCPACRGQNLPAIERCYRCHQLSPGGRTCLACRRSSALFSVRAVVPYETAAKQLVWKLKFEGAQAAARVMAQMMGERLQAEMLTVVPLPTASSRVRRRGYDQAHLMVRELARNKTICVQSVLVRLGQTQQRSASRRQRLAQLDGAFRLAATADVAGAHVLLVDDVITTGATLEAAARVLKQAGARRVSALVFAQA